MDFDLEDPMSMLSHFSLSTIIASLVFGVIGIFVFRAGKRNLNFSLISIGIALMAYPIFFTSPWLVWGIGIGLTALAYNINSKQGLTG